LSNLAIFSWNYLPAIGTAEGILLGTRDDVLRINNFCTLSYSVSYIIHDIPKNFSWKLVVVYGPAYEDKKAKVIDELHYIMSGWQGPIMFGGDFNLCRVATDKNNNRINQILQTILMIG
jgi:hypothetical protein